MKKSILLSSLIVFLFSTQLEAQDDYYNGYVVDNMGNKLSCRIKSKGNKNKAKSYVYSFEKGQKHRTVDVKDISAFWIEGEQKFSRQYISLDLSDDEVYDQAEIGKERQIASGHVFLQHMIENEEFTVYYFFLGGKEFFFYEKDSSGIQLLSFKKYSQIVDDGNIAGISYDNTYKQQLAEEFPCSMQSNFYYRRADIVDYYTTYMQEKGISDYDISRLSEPGFNILLRCNLNYYTYLIKENPVLDLDFGYDIKVQPGLELRYMFPYRNNLVGVFGSVDYFATNMIYNHGADFNSEVNIQGLAFPFGLVVDLDITENFSIHAKGAIVPIYLFGASNFSFYSTDESFDLVKTTAPELTAGFSIKRFSIDASYILTRNLNKKQVFNPSEFDHAKLTLSYKFFNPSH